MGPRGCDTGVIESGDQDTYLPGPFLFCNIGQGGAAFVTKPALDSRPGTGCNPPLGHFEILSFNAYPGGECGTHGLLARAAMAVR